MVKKKEKKKINLFYSKCNILASSDFWESSKDKSRQKNTFFFFHLRQRSRYPVNTSMAHQMISILTEKLDILKTETKKKWRKKRTELTTVMERERMWEAGGENLSNTTNFKF